MMLPTLHMRLLGDFTLVYGDAVVTSVNTPRLQALLAYLVLHRDAPQLRQHLAFLFWPDTSEAQARTNLRQLLHQLRHSLPDADAYLHADASTVGWHAPATLHSDVAAFEQALALAEAAEAEEDQRAALAQAAHLYHADLLPSCYDDWIIAERERLRQCHRHALTQLIRLLEARRDYAAAIGHAQRLLRDEPIDEAACRCLMRLLALTNDRAGALRVYHRCVTSLQRELAVEPSQTTRTLYDSLLRLDTVSAPTAERPFLGAAGMPFIGRWQEWTQLQALWHRAVAGEPCFALVTGEAGIGKSRLAAELLTWVHKQGASVATTQAYAAEGQLSLAPVTDWLRTDGIRPSLTRLDTVWRSEVARILPELLTAHPDVVPNAPILEFGQRQRFFEALARAMLAAPQPLLLLIDDLQWCDQETLEWLHFLLRFDPHACLCVIGTARAEEVPPHHPLRALLLQLRSTNHVTELALHALDASETAKLAAHVAGREMDVAAALRLYDETQGNPLFVVETMRAELGAAGPGRTGAALGLIDPRSSPPSTHLLPPRVYAVIAERLAQLSTRARELAGLAAVIERPFTLDLLLAVGQVDEDSAVRALDELWQKRIVREHGADSYEFTHDKLREVAYAELGAPQRQLLHRRVAQALAQIGADVPTFMSGQIAAHYDRAGMTAHAIPHYQHAAVAAQRLYANDDAIALLARALVLLERLLPGRKRDVQELNLHLALAPLYRMTKGWTSAEVEDVLGRALALCDNVGDDAQRAQVYSGLQSLYVVKAKLEKVQLVSDDLHHLAQWTHGITPSLEADMMLTGSRLHLGRLMTASAEFEQMIARHNPTQIQRIVEEQGWNYAVHARAWHAHGLWLLGYPEAALQRGHDAVRLAGDLAQPFNQALAATYLAMLQQFCADEATARAGAEQALELTRDYKAPYYHAWCRILVRYARACERLDGAAIASLRTSIEDFTASGARLRLPYYLGLLAQAWLRAGYATEGLAVIDEAMTESRAHNERWWDAELQRLRGDLLRTSGAVAHEAEAAYLRGIAIARAQQAHALELRAATSLARLRAAQRHTGGARRELEPAFAWFREGFDTPDLQAAQVLLAHLA